MDHKSLQAVKMKDFNQNLALPIFVVGAPRSGTSLTAKILGSHAAIFYAGESNYFEDIWTRRNEIGSLEQEISLLIAVERVLNLYERFDFAHVQKLVDTLITPEKLISRVNNIGRNYGSLYLSFISLLAESQGKTNFCDCTPKHLYYLDTIFSYFPNAKVIGCVRDPRDFLSSYKHYWNITLSKEKNRVRTLYNPIITSILWRSSINALISYSNSEWADKIILLKYEDLVAHPKTEVIRICNFLEIDFTAELLQIAEHNSSFGSQASGIFTSSVGRWRSSLTSEEIWFSQTISKSESNSFGYKPEEVSPSYVLILRTLLKAPLALINALRINTSRRGPVLIYLLRRVYRALN